MTGPLSARSRPPSRLAGGRPAGRRRPRGGGGGGDAGAADGWAAGTQLHQPTPGRSARPGRTRRRSAPLGTSRFGWGRGPRPPAQVASGAWGRGFRAGASPLTSQRGPYRGRMRGRRSRFSRAEAEPGREGGGTGGGCSIPGGSRLCTPCLGLSREPPKKGHARLHFQKDAGWIGNPDPCPAALFSVQYFSTSIAWELVFLLSHQNFTAVCFLSSVS